MKSIATIKIKIPKKEFLTDIIKEYSKCIQYISNKGFNSKHTKYIKSKYRYLRSRLQSKGTRSSRKLLKKISGKEKRFMRQCNHEISKAIVNSINPGDTIVMEDIK